MITSTPQAFEDVGRLRAHDLYAASGLFRKMPESVKDLVQRALRDHRDRIDDRADDVERNATQDYADGFSTQAEMGYQSAREHRTRAAECRALLDAIQHEPTKVEGE